MHDDDTDLDPDQLLLAAALDRSDLEAMLADLEAAPDDWARPEVAAVRVRAARYQGDKAVLEAQILQGLVLAVAQLRQLVLVLGVLVVLAWALAGALLAPGVLW